MFNQPIDPTAAWKSTEGLPEEQRKFAFEKLLTPDKTSSELDTLLRFAERAEDPVKRQQILDQQLAYNQKQMSGAFPYLMMQKIPDQIAQGFGNAAAMNILGARSAVDAMNQTLQAYPRTAFASAPFQAQKYFS